MNTLFSLPFRLQLVSDEISTFWLNNRRAIKDQLTQEEENLFFTVPSLLRGYAGAIGAINSQKILKQVEPQLQKLQDATDDLDRFLDDIAKLRQILIAIGDVIQLAADIVKIITPIVPIP